MKALSAAVRLLCLLLLIPSLASAQSYRVTALPFLPAAINNGGTIAGNTPGGAVLWQEGRLTPLADLGGNQSAALGLNDAGDVVGWAKRGPEPPSGDARVPVMWRGGAVFQLPTKGNFQDAAYAINNLGLIVGGVSEWDLPSEPAIWPASGTVYQILPWATPAAVWFGIAYSVTDAGRIAGFQETLSERTAVLWENGIAVPLRHRFVLPYGNVSEARDTNAAGTVVGVSEGFPVRWPREGGVMVLRNGPGIALAVNGIGAIVGRVNSFGAMRWDRATGIQNLNNWIPAGSGWVLIEARDVNDAGAIIGVGEFRGEMRSFLLTPRR